MYLKTSIIKMINDIEDEQFLQALEAMLEAYQQKSSSNFTMVGERLNAAQYHSHIKKIIQEVEAGNTISHDDLKKESESWVNFPA